MSRAINPTDRRIWLASGSPRRRTLLQQLGLQPIVRTQPVPEAPTPDETPTHYTRRLAQTKGRAVRDALGDALLEGPQWILAADTVVSLGTKIYEKPRDEDCAHAQLTELSGQRHTVTTSFWLGDAGGGDEVTTVQTQVQFRTLSPDEIARYINTGEPMDKAGSYGIQGIGGMLIAHIEGSYTNVVGLPITEVIERLRALNALEKYPFGEGAPS